MKPPKLIVGLDFETYFAKDYSLRNKATSMTEYVRDKQFKAQCVGIRTNRQKKARWYPHDQIEKALNQFDWSECGLLAHNTAFDGLILSHHYHIVPAYYYCSLSMARAVFSNQIGAGLDEVARYLGYQGKIKADALQATKGIRDLPKELMTPLGEYCADDVDDMWNIFREMLSDYPPDELDLIHLTINAYANPILGIDKPRATKELEREIREKKKLLSTASRIIGISGRGQSRYDATIKVLNSADQFAEALRDAGQEPPKKYSAKQKKPIYAFAKGDLDFQALEKHPAANIRNLVKARLAAKSTIGETRAARLLSHGGQGYPLPIMLNYCRAHTMRWSGGDKMNPQNFTRGGELRKSILAPKGYQIIVVDSAQIEARMVAWLAGQQDLLDIFASGGDPYCELASDIYGYRITKKDKKQRFVGKVGILGLGFGMGAPKYQYTLAAGTMGPPVEISLEEAYKVVDIYRRKNYQIKNFWKFMDRMLRMMFSGKEETYKVLHFHLGGVDVPNGLSMHYPELKAQYNPRTEQLGDFSYKSGRQRSKIYGGLFTENVVQCLARIVVGEQLLKIAERYRIVGMTHDECIYLAPTRKAKQALEYGIECMSKAPAWCSDLPVAAEGGFARSYGEAK